MTGMKFWLVASLTGAALAMPVLEERQSCSSQWGQCGGINYSGTTCCTTGNYCSKINDYYYQCLAGTGPVTSKTSALPSSTVVPTKTATDVVSSTTKAPVGSGTATYSGNPYSGVNLWANSYYRSEVSNLAIPKLSGAMATAAAKVADVPSFQWMDTFDHISLMKDTLADIRKQNAAGGNYAGQFVVYDLPDRDCAAAASNGEYSIANDGANKYKNYINTVKTVIQTYSDIRIILVIEPDSLANLVTNMNVAKCSNAHDTYLTLTKYAVTTLNLPNVAMYLDAGHAGWLGWPANQSPAAQLFAGIYKDAGKPAALRGLATNVANYNGWSLSSAPSYTSGNSVYDEKGYVNAMGPLLEANGWPGAHFITDQGRSGKQPTGQSAWGDWCNAKGTGFGTRPTSNTGHSLLDAFVWIKPGGESDGTSDTSAARYDYHCGYSDALQPAPEAGTWFQAYFEQLLTNANPSFL
ncbi:1, 4-beta cellobiohydrolase [Dactylonectria estremocensis]|uniref:Glucanase n=1 Tax=Dactylonectria estremocensis TaxID=1079267 RepID=A0A9P9DGS5_9HYPO|nr:1, 4-beta cellobiohydrolase [Dactylonectria estremocensis]